MRKILSLLHTYGGLFFFPLLFIFGLSAININHHFINPKQEWIEIRTHHNLVNIYDNQILAESIRDSLGLMGYCPNWTKEQQVRNNDFFNFSVMRIGVEYKIEANIKTGNIKISKRPEGFFSIMNALHYFNNDLPRGTKIINSWQYYKNLFVLYVFLAVISGIYLIFKSKKYRTSGLIALFSVPAFTILLFIYIWQIG